MVTGTVRYIGPVDFADGVWLGLELKAGVGKNDGSVQGRRYFSAKTNHGLLVRPSKVRGHRHTHTHAHRPHTHTPAHAHTQTTHTDHTYTHTHRLTQTHTHGVPPQTDRQTDRQTHRQTDTQHTHSHTHTHTQIRPRTHSHAHLSPHTHSVAPGLGEGHQRLQAARRPLRIPPSRRCHDVRAVSRTVRGGAMTAERCRQD